MIRRLFSGRDSASCKDGGLENDHRGGGGGGRRPSTHTQGATGVFSGRGGASLNVRSRELY